MTTLIEAETLDAAVSALSRLAAQNERKGERNLIFCEDKLTLICERGILCALKGVMNTEVMTFARFLSGPNVLSKQGSVMLISSIIEENKEKLLCFRERAASAVYETIAQLNASCVDETMLSNSAESAEGLLKNKLFDLALIFSLYKQKLKELSLLDESEYLSLLPEKISEGGLENTNLFFFGFPSFTQQAREGVLAALRCGKSVTGIFLAGEEDFFTNESRNDFLRLCEKAGEAPQRFAAKKKLSGEPALLFENLFSSAPTAEKVRTDGVFRFSACDEQEEMRIVGALIRREMSSGLRPREIAVLVPGEESFSHVEKCFREYKIPFYADKKRSFSEHPFCRFLLAVLSAVIDGTLPEDADEIASSRYFGLGGNEYRNYLLKFGGYRGAVRREIKEEDSLFDYDVKSLTACRERMLKILSLFPRRAKGSEYVLAVRALMQFFSAEEVTERLKENFTGAERTFLELGPLEKVLSEINSLAGERSFTAREFREELKNGLSALKISMIPQSLDAVFVGDVTESRFERVKTLFVVGLTEELPPVSRDSAVITDGEMEKLEKVKVEIEPKIAQVNARARESIALNLCAFEKNLYISYPLQKGGQAAEKSEIYKDIEKLFDMPPMPDLFPFDCCEKDPALLRLLKKSYNLEQKEKRDALYEFLKEEYGEKLPEGLLSENKKEKVSFGEKRESVSPTLLEKYFECPYASFVSRVLRLKEREERALLDTDAGNFIHAVLQKCADLFEEISSAEECRKAARRLSRELMETPRYAFLKETPQGEYTAQRLLREAEEVCLAAWTQVFSSCFHVKKTEENVSIPSISLSGKPDRIDWSEEFVRVIDYKTGKIDDTPVSYYTGRKLQLGLYLKAASADSLKPAGAFYFPASERFLKEGENPFRLKGFFCEEEEVLLNMDPKLEEGKTSEFFEGKLSGRSSGKGMDRENFDAFLEYSVLLATRAEHEMKEGIIEPSPYKESCIYCKYKSMCGFIGEPRTEKAIGCEEIARIVKREKGEI